MVQIVSTSKSSISRAADVLREGGLVGMPTETVYGLAANAQNGEAVARIFEAKGRPSFNPLIVHVNSLDDVQNIAEMSALDISLAERFWPGPLTMILKRRHDSELSELVSAGLPTVAVRIPSHKTARALIKECGYPIAAPSANKSGSLSPTTPQMVAQSLGDAVDLILADGACDVGLESTVVDCSSGRPVILRSGSVTAEDIGEDVKYYNGDEVKSPGQLLKHYAPDTPVRLNAVDVRNGEALLSFGSIKFMGLEEGGAASELPEARIRHLSEEADLYEAAANLFLMLKELDRPEHKAIAVMNIPETGIGVAINDRLRRAAHSSNI